MQRGRLVNVTNSLSESNLRCTLDDLATAFGLQGLGPDNTLRSGQTRIEAIHWATDGGPAGSQAWLGLLPSGERPPTTDLGNCVALVVDRPTADEHGAVLHGLGCDLLVTPGTTTLEALASDMYAAIHESAFSALTRALCIQRDLLTALNSPRVELEIVHRLSSRLHVETAIVTTTGNVIASSENFPAQISNQAASICAAGPDDRAIADFRVLVGPVTGLDATTHLMFVWPTQQSVHQAELEVAMSAADAVIKAHERAIRLARREDFAQRSRLLTDLLEGVGPKRMDQIVTELTFLDVPLDGPFTLHLIRGRSTETRDVDALLRRIRSHVPQERTLLLVCQLHEDIVLMYATNSRIGKKIVQQEGAEWHGMSAEFTDLHEVRDALRQARISLATGQRTGHLTPFPELDFFDFILGQIPADLFEEKTNHILARLSGSAMLVETIAEFFRQSMDIAATAEAMHLHPNTIRYRLSRIEAILGVSLSDPQAITMLYLVLRDQIREGSRSDLDLMSAI